MPALKVLYLAKYYYWWGLPWSGMLHLAMSPIGLRRRGHEVRFVCELRQGQVPEDDGVDVRGFDPPLPFDAHDLYGLPWLRAAPLVRGGLVRLRHLAFLSALWRNARRACADWRPDAIYCQAEQPAPVAWALARELGVPLVVHAYGGGSVSLSDAARPSFRVGRWLDFVAAYQCGADAYLVVDDGTGGDKLATALGAPSSRIHHWDIPIARPSPAAAPTWRSRLGIPPTAPVVIAAARMVPVKRMDLCLAAAAEALERTPDAYAILVGDGHERAGLEATAARLAPSVQERILFVGHVSRQSLSELLQESDVFLTLQVVSISGTNLRDAMLHGLCVVGVRHDTDRAVLSLIRDGETGRLVDERAIPTAGSVLTGVLADRELRTRLGAAARQFAESTFETWDARVVREEALLQRLCARAEPRLDAIGRRPGATSRERDTNDRGSSR